MTITLDQGGEVPGVGCRDLCQASLAEGLAVSTVRGRVGAGQQSQEVDHASPLSTDLRTEVGRDQAQPPRRSVCTAPC